MTFFDITLQTTTSLHPEGDPGQFISEYFGTVRGENDAGKRLKVGKVHAYRVNVGQAVDQGQSLFDVFDAHSQQMHFLHTLLFEPNRDIFKESLFRGFDALEMDLLIIDYVILAPQWRGLKLGLLAVRKMIDLLGGGCGLTVADIAPIDPDEHKALRVPAAWIPKNETAEERKEANQRLRGYFKRMGFRRIGRSPYYGLSMARAVPGLAELLRPVEVGD
jgi:hypothetical protein